MAFSWQEHEARQVAHGDDVARQAAARMSDRLILRPPFAPVARRRTRKMAPSIRAYSKSGSPGNTLQVAEGREPATLRSLLLPPCFPYFHAGLREAENGPEEPF